MRASGVAAARAVPPSVGGRGPGCHRIGLLVTFLSYSADRLTVGQHTVESRQRLNERLAVIDNAQRNITDLASQVTSLQSVLANKQQRGAFGQGRMEFIVQDGLPKDCYEFQFTLSNKCRPDCAVFLPDQRPLTIDAK